MAMSALAVADTKKASPQRRASWVAFALLLPGSPTSRCFSSSRSCRC